MIVFIGHWTLDLNQNQKQVFYYSNGKNNVWQPHKTENMKSYFAGSSFFVYSLHVSAIDKGWRQGITIHQTFRKICGTCHQIFREVHDILLSYPGQVYERQKVYSQGNDILLGKDKEEKWRAWFERIQL